MGSLDGLDGLVGLEGLADGLAALWAQLVEAEAEIQPPIMRLVSIIPPIMRSKQGMRGRT